MLNITLLTTGTITFTNNSNVLSGVGTTFLGLIAGDIVVGPDGKWYEIDAITTDTAATLTSNYLGSTAADAVGGVDWWIFKSSKDRDSVRTATRQLTDISNLYRKIVNATNDDQTIRLNKKTSADRAGMILQNGGLDLLQAGAFEDDEFSIRYLLASTWIKALGVNPTTGGVSLYSQLLFGNVVTAPTINVTANDLAPAGIEQASILRLSSSANRTLTGITTGAPGRALVVFNVGDYVIDLEDEGGTSSAANRFALGQNLSLAPDAACMFIYDGVVNRWRLLAGSGGSSGSSSGGDGDKGWSPILAYVDAGENKLVAQIADWTGGQGDKPATGAFIGATGLVTNASDAIRVNGPEGKRVILQGNHAARMIQWSYEGSIAWADLLPYDDISGPPATIEWIFSTSIAVTDPGDTKIAFNSASFANITSLQISSKERGGNDASAFVNLFDDSDSLEHRGILTLIDTGDRSKFAIFNVNGDIDSSGGYFKVPVAPLNGVIFASGKPISVHFMRTGDRGVKPLGPYSAGTTYSAGNVVVDDGSSYISLVNANVGNGITHNGSNSKWALLARGVDQAFVDAINATLTAATAQATAAANSATSAAASDASAGAHENNAADYANTAIAKADIATTQAGIATDKATVATTQAGIATTQAGIATDEAATSTTKATEASASASDAAASSTSATAAQAAAETARDQTSSMLTLVETYANQLANADFGYVGDTIDDTLDDGLVT
jgi:hypothetical protein